MEVNIKNVKPMFTNIVTTTNKYPEDLKLEGSDLIDSEKAGNMKEYQTVTAIGPHVRDIKVGDTVFINPKRYAIMKHKANTLRENIVEDNPVLGYNFDVILIDKVPHLLLLDSDVKFIAEVEEIV